MDRLRTLFRDRWALLCLLGSAGWGVAAGLGALMVMVSLVPAATAIAVAEVVGRVVDIASGSAEFETLVLPLVAVGGLLAFDQIGQSMLRPLRDWVASRVNGRVRTMVRQAVSARPGIGHLEDQVVRDAAALPVDDRYLFNMGAGAEGQLWLMARFVGALSAAAVVAPHSVPAAVVVFVLMVWQRALLRSHYAKAFTTASLEVTGPNRAAQYWSEVAGSRLGAKELRVFGFGPWAVGQFTKFSEEALQAIFRLIFRAFRLHPKVFVLMALASCVPFLLLARAGASGELSAQELAAAIGGVVAVTTALGGMGWEAYSIEAAVPQLAALRRLERFHDDERRAAQNRPTPPSAGIGHVPVIRFEQVSFSYPGTSHSVLHGLDLDLRAGQSVAIVGENGAGKTTLLKLLAGFYEPDEGRITVDGHDLRDLDPVWWRQHLAVIFQDFVRFELTALENVALAGLDQPDATQHAKSAAEGAGAAEIVERLSRGWETVLSREYRGGAELSGGQWQRVGLARALYAARMGGRILVLDEPTASLDVSAEVALFDQLLTHADGLTAIIVSHRFSTVRRADRIVVIEDGRVVEDGDHATLHAMNGRYARLYNLQASRFVEAAATTTAGEAT